MPAYGTAPHVPSFSPEVTVEPFVPADSVAAGSKSQQYYAQRPYGAATDMAFSAEVGFSGAPGTFEIDIEGAITDVDGAYALIGSNKFTAVNSSNYANLDFQTNLPFLRFHVISLANSVNLTAKLRMAG